MESFVCGAKKSGICPGSDERTLRNPKQGLTWPGLPVRSARREDGLEGEARLEVSQQAR